MINANGITTISATIGVNLLPEKNPSAGCNLVSEYLLYTHAVNSPAEIPPNTPMFVVHTTAPDSGIVKYRTSDTPETGLIIAPE